MSRINLPAQTIQSLPQIKLDHLAANAESDLLQSESARLLYEMMLTLDQKGGESNVGAASEKVVDSSSSTATPMSVYTRNTNQTADIKDKPSELDAPAPLLPSARSSLRLAWIWIVLAFAAGSVCYSITLHVAQELLPKAAPALAPVAAYASVTPTPASASSWIETVAEYQQLYTPETLLSLRPVPRRSTPSVDEFRAPAGWAIQAPNLRAAGFIFKGMQRLSFNGQPLIQMMYLPKNSSPVSLYIIKEVYPDENASEKLIGILNIISWRRNNLRYALIGEPENVNLAMLGKQISMPE